VTHGATRSLLAVAFVAALGVALPWVALAASQTVTIQDFNFSPVGVTVNAGDSVTWRNTGGEGHTATSNNGTFDTGVLNPGASKTIVFGTVGTFDYHCSIHPYMHGTVTVLAAVATTAPPTPPPTVAPTPTLPPTAAPIPTPTLVPTPTRTAAPTAAPTLTVAPASSAPAASAIPTALASATPTAPTVAAASPAATTNPTPAPTAAPASDAGPLPFVVGVVVVVAIAGAALYAMRRR
jgi:plastocyanin